MSGLEIGDVSQETREIEGPKEVRVFDESVPESSTSGGKDKGKRKLNPDDSFVCDDGGDRGTFMSLRSGKGIGKRGKSSVTGASVDLNVERENDEMVLGGVGRGFKELHFSSLFERVLRSEASEYSPSGSRIGNSTNYTSVEAVEVENLVNDDNLLNRANIAATVPVVDPQNTALDDNAPVVQNPPTRAEMRRRGNRERNRERIAVPDALDPMGRFREIARQNASRFAHFNREDKFGNAIPAAPREEDQNEVEDWPGPFSTAMKIIRDRAVKIGFPWSSSSTEKSKPPSIKWVPSSAGQNQRKWVAPSLMELCLKVLAANADAVTSLEGVPDAQRHKLCQLLCDSRRMNYHFFGLLIQGSPSEVRIKDSSWLTEEELDESFRECDTSKLTVLQLDQCGRCLPDYSLLSSIAKSANCFPLLSTLSITGACCLTDDGLSGLVLSAPTLRSINLSQCSLLTSRSIETLATTRGSTLRELYVNDCHSIDPLLILPALKKLEHLEVLSLAGIHTV